MYFAVLHKICLLYTSDVYKRQALECGQYFFIAVIVISSLLNAIYFFKVLENVFISEDAKLAEVHPKKEMCIRDSCKMEEVLRRELDAGAVGMSSGLVYIPCVYADTNEMIRLCKVLAEYGRPFVVHQRMEFNDVLGSMNELMNIVRNLSLIHI